MIYGYVCSDEKEGKNGNVYFIRDNLGNIKIGIAKDPIKRLKGLQTANPNELEIFYIMRVPSIANAELIENELHKKFFKYRKKGEWFFEEPVMDWLRNGKVVIGGYKFQNADW